MFVYRDVPYINNLDYPWTNGKKWFQIEINGGNWFTKALNPLRIAVCSTVFTNVWFAKANRVQHRVHKITTVTVTYVENCAYFLLVSKAICVNVQNLSDTQIISLQTKLIGCANSVAKSVAVWLAWRVTNEHIQVKGGVGEGERTWDKGGGHARNREDSPHLIYSCIMQLSGT